MIPSNTPIAFWTNLAYIISAFLILRGALKETYKEWKITDLKKFDRTIYSWLFGIAMLLMGIGSGLHHWFNTTNAPPAEVWAQLADERGMYVCFSILAGVIWSRQKHVVIVVAGAVVGGFLAFSADRLWADSMWFMPALATLCIGGIWRWQGWQRALIFFTSLLGIAMIREAPEANFWPRDTLFGYDELHGLWHVVTAYFIHKMYRSTGG